MDILNPTKDELTLFAKFLDKLRRYVSEPRRMLRREHERISRNAKCHCGSEKKFKHCCWADEYQPGEELKSPIFMVENKKNLVYFNKKYRRIHGKDHSSSLQTKGMSR